MTARQWSRISPAATDNSSTSGLRMSRAELVKHVSHPVEHASVSRAVNALPLIVSNREESQNIYFQSFQNVTLAQKSLRRRVFLITDRNEGNMWCEATCTLSCLSYLPPHVMLAPLSLRRESCAIKPSVSLREPSADTSSVVVHVRVFICAASFP